MDKKPIRLVFFKYILANVISSLGVSVYILIDTLFISKGMGSEGLAALNLSLPVFNFLNGFGLMLGMSVTVMADNQYLTFTGTESFRIKTDNESNYANN